MTRVLFLVLISIFVYLELYISHGYWIYSFEFEKLQCCIDILQECSLALKISSKSLLCVNDVIQLLQAFIN